MRNIPLTTGLIILGFYILISFLSWITLKNLIKYSRHYKMYRTFFWIFTALQTLSFGMLFIYPFNTSTSTRYSFYFFYNSILICDIFSRFPLVAGSILFPFVSRNTEKHYIISVGSFVLSISVLLIFFWGFSFGPRTLSVKNIDLSFEHLPDSFDGYRLAQISDLHLGSFQSEKMLDRVIEVNNRFNPDIMVFTGDLVNNFSYEADKWKEMMAGFKATKKIAVPGNHDYGYYYRWPDEMMKEENYQGILNSYHHLGYVLLKNSAIKLKSESDSIYVVGVENWGHPPFPQYADLNKATTGIPENSFKILLSHDPAHWDSVVKYMDNFPITLSGHSHGLQWGIKLAGIEFSLIYLSRNKWAGLYEYNENFLYVNRGLGTIGIPIRIDMPAEITLITLRKK